MPKEDEDSPPDFAARVALRIGEEAGLLLARPMASGLYLVATPIGHLGDMTLRALAVLARADAIYCEDTRHSRTLLAHYGIGTPTRPYHEHNAEAIRPRILAELAEGKTVALISDAGTPLISDPGYKVAREARDAGYRVESLPGASAVLAALTSSGLPTDAFFFAGFLPPKTIARRTRIAVLRDIPGTLVVFEAPSRLAATLADLAEVLGPRPAALARELTKFHEEIVTAPLDELAARFIGAEPKGECVIVVGAGEPQDVSDTEILVVLAEALTHDLHSTAVKSVADRFRVARSRVYDLGLRLKSERIEADDDTS